jgi:hypothetical protein
MWLASFCLNYSSRLLLLGIWLSCFGAGRALAHSGYTQDISQEREEQFQEIFLFVEAPPQRRDLSQKIFNPKLSREFKEKYRDQFGDIDSDSFVYKKARYQLGSELNWSLESAKESSEQRRVFAEFMVKRLTEWHVDDYFKNEPSMRTVYETKEKLSNIKIEVGPQSRFDFRYSFSGNTLDILWNNPLANIKYVLEMSPSAFGPGPAQRERVWITRPLSQSARLEAQWFTKEALGSLSIFRNLGTTWTFQALVGSGTLTDGIVRRESLASIGFGRYF